MTKRECAIVMAFTGTAMLKGDDLNIFYQYLSEIMGRTLYTHEIGILADEIKESARADFIRLCSEADGKRAMTNADRVRQMTDEELEELLEKATDTCSSYHPKCEECPLYFEAKLYKCSIGEWLKQEVEEDAES